MMKSYWKLGVRKEEFWFSTSGDEDLEQQQDEQRLVYKSITLSSDLAHSAMSKWIFKYWEVRILDCSSLTYWCSYEWWRVESWVETG